MCVPMSNDPYVVEMMRAEMRRHRRQVAPAPRVNTGPGVRSVRRVVAQASTIPERMRKEIMREAGVRANLHVARLRAAV